MLCASWSRWSARSRALSSIDTRAALCTTRLSAIATRAPTSAMAALSFHLSPVRMSACSRRPGSRRRVFPRMPPRSGLQLVAEATDRLDAVLVDLRAQPLHMDVDDPGVTAPAVVPHALQELVPGQDSAR